MRDAWSLHCLHASQHTSLSVLRAGFAPCPCWSPEGKRTVRPKQTCCLEYECKKRRTDCWPFCMTRTCPPSIPPPSSHFPIKRACALVKANTRTQPPDYSFESPTEISCSRLLSCQNTQLRSLSLHARCGFFFPSRVTSRDLYANIEKITSG